MSSRPATPLPAIARSSLRRRAARAVFEACESRVMLAAGFNATYFNNADLTSPAYTRTDAAINFDWGTAAPVPGVSNTTFSVRWAGQMNPTTTETYTFFVTADDGFRLWVNGQVLVERWSDRPRLLGDANADGVVSFADYQVLESQSGTAGPQADFNNDQVVDFRDFRILNSNYDKSLGTTVPTTTAELGLTAGQTYDVVLEYFNNDGQATAKLEWGSNGVARQPVPPPAGSSTGAGANGLLGTYYNEPGLSGWSFTRLDPNIDFEWYYGSPDARIELETFSAKWSGYVQIPTAGTYTFHTDTDDGVRLWINNQKLVDSWAVQDALIAGTPITLAAGTYPLKMEYFQSLDHASARLMWQGPGIALQPVPTSRLFISSGSPTIPPPEPPPTQQPSGELRVSDNGRYLVYANGSPFFYLGDTAWSLFNRTSRADVDLYLNDRASKEFTVTQAVFRNGTRGNHYGQPVFLNNDPAQPNPLYFEHADYVISKAKDLGLYVALLPTWGNEVGDPSRRVFTAANAYAYGLWLGQRYKDQPNIIWVLGGDEPVNETIEVTIWREMARGLAAGDQGKHLMTYHPYGGDSASEYMSNTFHNETWLDFTMTQSGHTRDSANAYGLIATDYSRTPTKPVIDFEPNYENIPNSLQASGFPLTDHDVRKKLYWGMFAGGFGAAYGAWEIYGFTTTPDARFEFMNTWQEALNYPGARQMKFLRRLMQSRPYESRAPFQNLIVNASQIPNNGNHIQATRAADKSYAMVYTAGGLGFTVQMTEMAGPQVDAWWYDPRTGEARYVGRYANTGTRAFSPPTDGTAPDWILVLDQVSRNFGTPGNAAAPVPAPAVPAPAPSEAVAVPVVAGSTRTTAVVTKPVLKPAVVLKPVVPVFAVRPVKKPENAAKPASVAVFRDAPVVSKVAKPMKSPLTAR